MAEIHILDSNTIDKIAAGEVVERPASVVKELVENAIDAGSSAITVEIKDGGTSMIRVTDNGCGIEKSELKKAFMRHATSKIETAEDLESIHSLGFRGEALSSISAVSMVEMITKTENSITGTRVVVEGAVVKAVDEVGAPTGTTLVVRNLFFNTPARRKFLKSAATEGSYVSELMEHLALSRADISFTFRVNGQLRFHTPGNNKIKDVIYMLYGKDMANDTIALDETSSDYHLYGFLGKPSINRSNRNFEIYFVNGRYIRSNIISKAIEEGGRGYYMQHKFPFCVLMLEVPPELMDVNVHPTKLEVRFSNQNALFDFIMDSVRMALKSNELIPEVTIGPEIKQETSLPRFAPEPFEKKRIAQEEKEGIEGFEKENKTGNVFTERKPYNVAAFSMKGDQIKPVIPSGQHTNDENTQKFENFFEDKSENAGKTIEPVLPGHQILNEKSEAELAKQSLKALEILTAKNHSNLDPQTKEELPSDFLQNQTDKGLKQNDFSISEDVRKTDREKAFTFLGDSNLEQIDKPNRFDRSAILKEQELAAHKAQTELIAKQKAEQLELFDERMIQSEKIKDIQLIGQVFDTYWMFTYDEALYICDQHAAHEKVNFERLIKKLKDKQVTSQQVNPPVVVTLTGKELHVLDTYKSYFEDFGFEIENFGGSEVALRAIPQDLYGCDEKTFFEELLDELSENEIKGTPQVVYDKIASMSCKAAVKGNNKLSAAEAKELFKELFTLENPYHCPHGRPTLIKMTQYELDRKFKRIL